MARAVVGAGYSNPCAVVSVHIPRRGLEFCTENDTLEVACELGQVR